MRAADACSNKLRYYWQTVVVDEYLKIIRVPIIGNVVVEDF